MSYVNLHDSVDNGLSRCLSHCTVIKQEKLSQLVRGDN